MGSLPAPGDVQLHSFQQDCSLISRDHKLNGKLTVSQFCIYNQEVFLTWIIFANYNRKLPANIMDKKQIARVNVCHLGFRALH